MNFHCRNGRERLAIPEMKLHSLTAQRQESCSFGIQTKSSKEIANGATTL